ncbi:restriction endonuclease [Xylella fastidiosa]|uniref:restriction endonuclease n=1 Tax=Xylella fastidiosa TaxID=2371 RepID=UPI001F4E331E|nr:restriction endonuclease [Xylella fastidiosa]
MRRKGRRRKDSGVLDELVRAPWYVSVALGGLSAIFFFLVAPQLHLPDSSTNPLMSSLDTALHASGLLRLAGWISMLICLLVAGMSWRQAQLRKELLDRQRSLDDLRAMSWKKFELLVGECFRRQGYRVSETGKGGADGGIDLLLHRDSERVLVQCKQWRTFSVGVPVVREMFGLMIHHDADRVKIVCCGNFTRDAVAFAKGKPIDLINGDLFLGLVKDSQGTY